MPQEAPKEAEPAEVPWHAAFPNPKTVAGAVSRDEVLQWLQHDKSDFVLIDLRRMDCEVSYFSLESLSTVSSSKKGKKSG
jgi:hypothetical protein